MKICAAQIYSEKGNVSVNIEQHVQMIRLAAEQEVDLIIFPELSITGYEPGLAKALAIFPDNPRLNIFQNLADQENMTIGIGAPTVKNDGVCISMIYFSEGQRKCTYSKQFLHEDEFPFFIPGDKSLLLEIYDIKLAPAICYESFRPEHSEAAKKSGAEVYLSSVSKSVNGIREANSYFPVLANKQSMTILMANNVGPSDNFVAAGGSAIWNNKGILKGQLSAHNEGLLIYDVERDATLILPFNSR